MRLKELITTENQKDDAELVVLPVKKHTSGYVSPRVLHTAAM